MSEKLLEMSEVDAVMQFAQGLAIMDQFGIYSPWLQNQMLNGLNNNAKIPTLQKIKDALSSYKQSAPELQSYMEFMQKFDMLFARTMMSYVNTLSFDLQIVCKNAFTQSDYESGEFVADKQAIYKFLDSFDYMAEFRKMALEVMRHEVVFAWFRKTKWGNKGMKATLQLLPQNRCLLTGYWEKGLLFDFDMNYFLQPGVDIEGYDPAFKKYFNNVFGGNQNVLSYQPTTPLKTHDGTFAMWTQTSPEDGSACFKFDTSNFNTTPFLAPYMKDVLRNDEIAALQYNKDMASAYAILAGEIRLFDNAKSGTKSDQFAINPKTLGAFMSKVKQGLNEQFKAVAMPTENTKMYQYTDSNTGMYSNNTATVAGLGSGVSRVLYSSDRMSNAELQYAAENDYNTMKPLYSQFNNFLEFWANKLTKKYKFKFILDGCGYSFDRDKRFDKLIKLADKGIVLNSSAYASALGMRPMDFDYSLSEGKYGDMQSKLSMLLNANTMKDGGAGGAPRKEATDLTDSGEMSREGLED